MLLAGFTEVFVMGMPTRWINTKTKPMAIPAIDEDAGERAKDKGRELPGKSHDAEKQR